jgi:cysteinyl-tRNA synthetase
MPRATDYIQQQIEFVKGLEEKGYTYVIEDGVYFDTSKLTDYGKLARLDIDGLQFGARVADTGKKSPTDFALWKFSPADQRRDMEWESPFDPNGRKGYPGWHLECSVLARELLGDTIDIHTGGIDHIPVHHTNEIAQSESLTGKPFSNLWVHSNHIKVDGTKMSKSLGNIYTLYDIRKHGFSLYAFKLMIISKHYTTEGNFTWDNLEAAQNSLTKLYAWADRRHQTSVDTMPDELNALWGETLDGIKQDLSDDLNTPAALTRLYKLVTYMENIQIPNVDGKNSDGALGKLDAWLGLNLNGRPDITDEQKDLMKQRQQAREDKDFTKSDQLREELKEQGLIIRDTEHGQIWERV